MSDEIDMAVVSVPATQNRLDNLKLWLDNPEYQCFLAGTRQSILGVEQSILSMRPNNPENIAFLCELYGKRDLLLDNLSLFENARTDLETQLSTLLDEATTSAQTQIETE